VQIDKVAAHTPFESTYRLKLKKFTLRLSPIEVFSKIHQCSKNAFILESIEGPRKLAQYSFIGFNPSFTIKIKNGEAIIQNEKTGEITRDELDEPFDAIEKVIKSQIISYSKLRFLGGAVGYVSYDAIRYWESLPSKAVNESNFFDIVVGIYNEVNSMLKEHGDSEAFSYDQPKVTISRKHFEKSVEKAREYVAAGDVLQVVLSKRYEFNIEGNLIGFYRSLREINPSPYMYFLKMGDRQIVGSSPEMLVRVDNRIVETYPIAGTKHCGKSPSENRKLAKELLSDPKERAEHVMLVDLARNDIGKVSKFGSVKVPKFMQVHRYSHVQHIVSQVTGNLRDDCDCYDALRAVFPAGTVSGAPKVRAMEIIEELELERRGPYAGAVGYFSYNGNADFAIAIRTLFATKNKAYIQVGAGIVADSIPEREWFETEHKSSALMKALAVSGGEMT
jgi:anthranilate synthase component 1